VSPTHPLQPEKLVELRDAFPVSSQQLVFSSLKDPKVAVFHFRQVQTLSACQLLCMHQVACAGIVYGRAIGRQCLGVSGTGSAEGIGLESVHSSYAIAEQAVDVNDAGGAEEGPGKDEHELYVQACLRQ
jgi:hypothetical protein